jgi:hypothetical protein
MLKLSVSLLLTLVAIAPSWSAPVKATGKLHPVQTIIYAQGNVRIHGASHGETIIYCSGNVRVHGILKQGQNVITATKTQ